MLFCASNQAQQFSDDLNHAEQLIVQKVTVADNKLRDLELVVASASNAEKLRWLTLSLNVSAIQYNETRLQQLKTIYPKLLTTFDNQQHIWSRLFYLTFKVIIDDSTSTLTQLQVIETEVDTFNDPFMSAFFYRTLYYSFMNNNILDVALDIAIKNQRQWLALEEFYLALEMQLNMTRIRANAMADINAEQLISSLAHRAKTLKATTYTISIAQLKAQYLIQRGKPQQAYDLLDILLNSNNTSLIRKERLTLMYYLATTSFALKNYNETIRLAKKIITGTTKMSLNNIHNTSVLLAKALVESGDYKQSAKIIADIQQSIKAGNDNYLLLQLNNIEIDILYKSNDIDGLYKAIKTIVDTITTPQVDSHMSRRIARAEKAAYVETQSKVLATLAKHNLTQQQELQINAKVISSKDYYLLILSVLCFSLFVLFIGLIYLIKRIKVLANTDGLTAISNRRHGILLAEKKLKNYLRFNRQEVICFAILDLDFFKKINDTYGHATGDKVIKLTVKLVNSMLTKNDVICRMGGEEFLIVIVARNKTIITTRLKQVLSRLAQKKIADSAMTSTITASIGVTFADDSSKDFADYIIEADEALYQAKQRGRNQVCYYIGNSLAVKNT